MFKSNFLRIFVGAIQECSIRLGFRFVTRNGWESINRDWREILDLRHQVNLNKIDLEIIKFILEEKESQIPRLSDFLETIPASHAGFRQDIAALIINGFKRNGSFIEIGACDGVVISNTLLLEKEFGWSGVLVEPDEVWHDALLANRKTNILKLAAWSHSNVPVKFNREIDSQTSHIDFSGYVEKDPVGDQVVVDTISLNDIIQNYFSIFTIDFLSIDTEGSEYEILSTVDFSRYHFNLICIEHNYQSVKRMAIKELLLKNGYRLILHDSTYVDDWYVPRITL